VTDHTEALRGKKILFVFASLDLGGAERRGILLADYLQKRLGALVHIVGLSEKPGRLSQLCEQLGLKWSGVPFHWGARRRLPSLLRAVFAIRSAAPDIVLSYTRVPNLVCAWGWKWIGAKALVWNQADEGLLLTDALPYRIAAGVPTCFISNSTGGRKFLLDTYGVPPAKVHLVRNGVALAAPCADRGEWRKQWGVHPNALVAGMVANLSIYKDHETLLRAWSRVVSEYHWESEPLLVLAGRCDGVETRLTGLALELGIQNRVKILGPVDDVAGLLGAIDLFAYSSKSEGLPNGVLEAMAAGLPVVGTDIPGIREALGSQGEGYLSPVGDSTDLAKKIVMLLQDQQLRKTLGQSLQMRIEKEFSLGKMCSSTAELISLSLKQAR